VLYEQSTEQSHGGIKHNFTRTLMQR